MLELLPDCCLGSASKLDHVTCWTPFPLAFEGVLFIKSERPSHVEGAWEIAVKQVRL